MAVMILLECNNVGVEQPYDDPMNLSSEPCPLNSVIEEVPDHSHISDDKIPRTGMYFDSLEEAHDFYKNYAEKSIHCHRDGNRMSRAKAPRRSKKIAAAMCNARVYVKFNKDNSKWFPKFGPIQYGGSR
ncbi:hypothetical protein PIB30_001570 [Stylosanthes scabra]|uniref:FAR1 domain-containing protein n=1 Tax=Stylosanthes scabra TaxID=79078 RepID=A0ABU6R1U7_9FABA|nr:hypothetical protein [Stylosanthes scabra]